MAGVPVHGVLATGEWPLGWVRCGSTGSTGYPGIQALLAHGEYRTGVCSGYWDMIAVTMPSGIMGGGWRNPIHGRGYWSLLWMDRAYTKGWFLTDPGLYTSGGESIPELWDDIQGELDGQFLESLHGV